ncbi:3-keto-5-aminohexanoate cleavage protein [Marivita sp.]|uniref:3-keto-5-aminohexanoate cleavage protein n=1 Tax=Marivita sp. TaxID=2003365 RepID=UPI003F6BE7CF
MSKIIVTCAITGSIHTPSMSPYLPVTADQITSQAVDAAEAGAAILHLHARDPDTGKPSASPEHFAAFLPRIKQASGAVLNISTGGSAVMSLEERLAPAMATEPEMCSLNMGTMNFALYQAAARVTDWKHDWEKPFLEDTDDLVFKNTPRDIAAILRQIGQARGARFEFECYDVGHLYMLRHFADRGLVEPPFFIQFVFGVLGGIGADPENLMHMKTIADKLFGEDYLFSVLAAGRHQIPFTTMAAAMGGHVRVGLEDNLMISRGKLAERNADQVAKIRRIVEEIGREPATPDEVRVMLGLKGADQTVM